MARALSVSGLALALLGACGRGDRIVIGAKNFTESDLLAEIVAQQLERRLHHPVERRLHLGGTFVCHQAILAGQIDLYPEYSGTAFTAVLKHPAVSDRDSVTRVVEREYAARFGLRWLAPFGFDNTFAILVRGTDARRDGFLERSDGFAGLARVYGLAFRAPPTAMDLGITYRALADRKVDLIAGNSTDGQIAALDLVALEDDRLYFPPYQAAVVARQETLRRHPEMAAALAQLQGKIDDAEMRRLNALADVRHQDIRTIARTWLEEHVP